MTPCPEPRPEVVVDVVCRSLTRFFTDDLTPSDCAAPVDVTRLDALASSCTLQLQVPHAPSPRVQFTVQHVGGNVYDVRGGLDGRPNRSFTYSLPDVETPPPAPTLGRTLGRFLISELKHVSGERVLTRTLQTA